MYEIQESRILQSCKVFMTLIGAMGPKGLRNGPFSYQNRYIYIICGHFVHTQLC